MLVLMSNFTIILMLNMFKKNTDIALFYADAQLTDLNSCERTIN